MILTPQAGGNYFLIEASIYPGHYFYTPNRDHDLKLSPSIDKNTDWIEI